MSNPLSSDPTTSLISGKFFRRCIIGMRLALALVFLWFGLLKFSPYNPVFDLLNSTLPFLATPPGIYFLAGLETLIGLGLLLNIFPKLVHGVLIFHLAGTFSTFFVAPSAMFNPHFPFLNLAGEFVIKNFILAIGGLLVLYYEQHKHRKADN